MSIDSDKELLKLFEIACSVVVEDTNKFSAVLSARRRAKRCQRPKIKAKQGRLIYARPTYTCSTWWTMLQKGDCKVDGHPQNKVFRRRFSVPFTMFKAIVSEAREWITDGGKRMGDVTTDCVGIKGVPFELKVLGALRMSTKGCSFDAIAELSGCQFQQCNYSTMRSGRKATIVYEVTVNRSGRCLHISCGHPGSRNDKTIVKTDKLVMDLKDNKILQDVEYKLFIVSTSVGMPLTFQFIHSIVPLLDFDKKHMFRRMGLNH